MNANNISVLTPGLESPFLNQTNFVPQPVVEKEQTYSTREDSPFRSVYELEGHDLTDPGQEALVELMDELYDEEFDELIQDLANEAQDVYEAHLEHSYGSLQQQELVAERLVEEHFAPLFNELESYLDHLATVSEKYDRNEISEAEWELEIDRYTPVHERFEPQEEQFFGKLKKKLKKVTGVAKKMVKKGIGLAKKLGLGGAIRLLKKLASKFLKAIAKKAMGKLPEKYRPLAKKLADKLPGLKSELDEEENAVDEQQEFDLALAELMLAPSETDQEMIVAEFLQEADYPAGLTTHQSDDIRADFVRQLSQLREGENPEPVIEQFAAAILTGLKWGIRIMGRERVKKQLVKLTAKLISKLIGKQYSKELAKKMVNVGFSLLNLEFSEEEMAETGSGAVAAVVEETIRQVTQLPDQVLDNEALLEGHIVESFENAAAAYLPDVLSEEVYKKHPRLRESSRHKVLWKAKGLGKKRLRRIRYKKLNKEIETELTPQLAEEIRTYGGFSLAKVLRDQLGVRLGAGMPVKVHLFETLPGSRLYHIAKYERSIPIQNTSSRNAAALLHPLTSIASGLLMGEPGLGCRKTKCLGLEHGHSGGHRYYYLEIPNARLQIFRTPGGVEKLRQPTHLKIKLDFVKNHLCIRLFLSETDAQHIALQLRQQYPGNALLLCTEAVREGLKYSVLGKRYDYLRIIHPAVIPGRYSGNGMSRVPLSVQRKLEERLIVWLGKALGDLFRDRGPDFIQAADNDLDGVTIRLDIPAPPDFDVLGQIVAGKNVPAPDRIFNGMPEVLASMQAGYNYD
jgi:hypothetical protein